MIAYIINQNINCMKTLTSHFVTLIFFLTSQFGYSQDYIPFYLNNVKWTMERVIPVIGPEDAHSYWEIYTLNDTLINNKIYRKLATKNICELFPDFQGNLQLNNEINTQEFVFGGIREENKKIYFLKFDQKPEWTLLQSRINNFTPGEDHLLYDFNIIPGDTIHYSGLTSFTVINGDTTYSTTNYFSIVTDILSPVQGHNRYEVANSSAYAFPFEAEPLLEGIGSSYGFFGSYDSYLTYLICFSINDEILLFDHECEPCSEILSKKTTANLVDLKIYPNPVKNELFINNTTNLKVEQIKIVDITGKLILTKRQLSNNIRIDFSTIQRGTLLLYIKFENGFELIKKVVSI